MNAHTAERDAPRCEHPHGVYDVTCARPAGHDGGHVGPFYVEPSAEDGALTERAEAALDAYWLGRIEHEDPPEPSVFTRLIPPGSGDEA